MIGNVFWYNFGLYINEISPQIWTYLNSL